MERDRAAVANHTRGESGKSLKISRSALPPAKLPGFFVTSTLDRRRPSDPTRFIDTMAAVAFTPVSIQASAARPRATVRGARAVRAVSGLGSSAALAPRPSVMRALGLGVAPRTGARSADLAVRAMADEEKDDKGAGVKQLLGIRGGERTDDIWKIRLQLTKPVTWVPLIWGVMCGAAASGHYTWTPENIGKAMLCMFMSGPLLTGTHPATPIPPYPKLIRTIQHPQTAPLRARTPPDRPPPTPRANAGYTQTINDWEDREIDAINEPDRPIPSGAISEFDVQVQIYVLLFGGWACAWTLDQWCEHDFPIVTALTLFGSWISYIYSAPPLKLKQNGWLGNYALGASYIALPWWAGQALFGS